MEIAVNEPASLVSSAAVAELRMEPARPRAERGACAAEEQALCGPRAGRLHYCHSAVNFVPFAHEDGECLFKIFAES
jgi:hypothetical protein